MLLASVEVAPGCDKSGCDMVKEGVDSTVRPKVTTYEFDNGRIFMDVWAADGKPVATKRAKAISRVVGVITLTAACGLVMSDWTANTMGKDHVFTPVQRFVRNWWRRFIRMDDFDGAKAMSVAPASNDSAPAATSRWYASDKARQTFYQAATVGKPGTGS